MTPEISIQNTIDLDAYTSRIGFDGDLTPTEETLHALHFAHATHIPFENLSLFLGQPIRIDIPSLQNKLITQRRGGYCFEQNLLFAAVLEAIGFRVSRLAARVRFRMTQTLPRTHAMLLVSLEDSQWLVDVGFGAEGLFYPVPFCPSGESQQFAWTYRVVPEEAKWVLQSQKPEGWEDMYAFTLEPQELVDFEVANYYVSTYPESRFLSRFTAQIPSVNGRYILRNYELTHDTGEATTVRTLQSDEELLEVMRMVFGLEFPAGNRFVSPKR